MAAANIKWVPWPSSPRLYIDLKRGRKTIVTVRKVRITAKRPKWQVIQKYVDPMGGAIGPVFPSLKAAKEFVEGRL